jgi:signal transduction histidine kinase/DNA-binding response OmpR family regulator
MDFLPNLNAARILVAESDPDEMDRTAYVLEDAGYYVQKEYFAGDALFALKQHSFDLALVDPRMVGHGQRALSDELARFASVRWIALVDDQFAEPQRLLRQGAAGVIRRPVNTTDLLSQVRRALDGESPDSAESRTSDRARDDAVRLALEQRLIEQRTLSALARSLSAVLDLDDLLNQVVDAAVRLSNAEEGLLLLPDEDARTLLIRAVKGIDAETARTFRVKTQDTLAGQVFQTGKPVLVGDQGWQKVKTEYLVKSLLYVPLSIKGEIIGVLGVNNKRTDRAFTRHDQDLLQDLAAHAAVAIENARLYEDSVLRARELGTLARAGEAANSTLEIEEVLSIIADQLMSALDVSQCYVGEWNPDHQELRALAARHYALWQAGQGRVFFVADDPAIARAFSLQGAEVASPLPQAEHPACAWLPHRYLSRGIAYVPLSTQDQPLGLVTLYRMRAPIALDSLPLAQLRPLALDLIVTLTDITSTQRSKLVYRQIQQILQIGEADWCEVALWNPALAGLNTVVSCGEVVWRDDPKPGLDLRRFPTLVRLLEEQAAFTGAPTDDLRPLLDAAYSRSLLAIPIVIKEQTAGLVLLADTRRDRRFSRAEVRLAQALVMQAANALDNARLYRDLQVSLVELHRAQSRLVQAARLSAMGELAAAVAHQINNPLTTVLGDSELVLRDLPPDDANRESLEAVHRAGKRALEVVRRLLTMARQQPTDEKLEPIDVNETIRHTLTLAESHVRRGSVMLTVALGESLPAVTAIRGQLEDVWLNLLLNARDAVTDRPDPQIAITSAYDPERDQVMVTVRDNGIGIPEELQEQVFEPFFSTKPVGEGTGLGLRICQQIVGKCGGRITLQSAYNQGAEFTVVLPAYRQA